MTKRQVEMEVSSVVVVDDDTVHGHVVHRTCRPHRYVQSYRLDMDSAGKCHSKHAHIPQIPNFTAGQDTYTYTKNCIAVSDGHGTRGHHIARALLRGTNSILDMLETHAPKFQSRLAANESPYNIARDIRQRVSTHIASVTDADSGATFAAMLFLTEGARRWAITVNIGDSEALLAFEDHVHLCSVAHNWDNASLYRRYVRYCTSHGLKPARVCYNRWNDRTHKYKLRDIRGEYQPIWMYSGDQVDMDNARHVNNMFGSKMRYGTQSIRVNHDAHENWGSCVFFEGKARGQSMATFGDMRQRKKTNVPIDLCHVYVYELAPEDSVVAIVQTDGVSNGMTLAQCGRYAPLHAKHYLEQVGKRKDDMCVCMARWTPM